MIAATEDRLLREEALRAAVQRQLELATLGLSQQVPALLHPAGPKFTRVEIPLTIGPGETLLFRASLELVE